MRLIDYFDNGCNRNPGAICLVDDESGDSYSYQSVHEMTCRIANGLLAEGLQPETRCAVLSANDAIAFTCTVSILRAGLAWTPVNPRESFTTMHYVLSRFDCAVLFFHSEFEPVVARIREAGTPIKRFICLNKPSTHGPSLQNWARGNPATDPDVACADDGVAILAPTGGTTGRPKGLRLTHRAMSAFMMAQLEMTPHGSQPPVYLAAAPMTHASGFVALPVLARGGSIVIQNRVEPERFLRAIPQYSASILFLPPTVIYDLLDHPAVDNVSFESLKYFIYGAAPMSPDKLLRAVKTFGPVMTQVYGQGECGFPVAYLSPEDHADAIRSGRLERLGSCGRPAPATRMAIMNENGILLPDECVGEIVLRTEMQMGGYHKDPDQTAAVSKFGWHHTGDIGYRDGEGFYYVVDRQRDMIITGGFNVYSTEVEAAVMSHRAVLDCAVIGVPHPKWGEAVKAVVQRRTDDSVTAEELIALCKQQIGSVKAPKTIDFVDSLPRSPNGKVLKRMLRDRYWQGRSRQIS